MEKGTNTKDHRLSNASFPALQNQTVHDTCLDIIILQDLPSSSPQAFCTGPCPCYGNPDLRRWPVKQQAIAGCHRKRSNIIPGLLVEQASIPIIFENIWCEGSKEPVYIESSFSLSGLEKQKPCFSWHFQTDNVQPLD